MTTVQAPAATGLLSLEIDAAALGELLNTVKAAVPGRTTLPILNDVRLEVSAEGVLIATATDLEIAISARTELEDHFTPGALCVPFKILSDTVNHLDGALSLEALKGGRLRLRGARFDGKLPTHDLEDFPPTPGADAGGKSLGLPAAGLAAAIERSAYAAAKDQARPVLAGVLLASDQGEITLAGADGFRLAIATVPLESIPGPGFAVIVPAPSLRALLPLLKPARLATLSLAPAGNRITVTTESAELSSRLIEGQFPDFARIIPTEPAMTLRVERVALLDAARVCATVARDSSNLLRLDPAAEAGLMISAHSTDSEAAVTLDAENEGEPVALALNVAYLIEALASFDQETVTIHLTSPTSPVLIDAPGTTQQAVVMTMHVSRAGEADHA